MPDIDVYHSHLINEFQLIQVMDDMKNKGITSYSVRPGNNCIWVSYPRIECYYIFRDGEIIDIQYD